MEMKQNIRFKVIDSNDKEHIRKVEIRYSIDLMHTIFKLQKYYKAKYIYFGLYGTQYVYKCNEKKMEIVKPVCVIL